jgi:hypothetical protein
MEQTITHEKIFRVYRISSTTVCYDYEILICLGFNVIILLKFLLILTYQNKFKAKHLLNMEIHNLLIQLLVYD